MVTLFICVAVYLWIGMLVAIWAMNEYSEAPLPKVLLVVFVWLPLLAAEGWHRLRERFRRAR